MYRSRKALRRARSRMLFCRALVVALLLATALTMAWLLPSLSEIVQGAMLTVAFMVPVCVFIVINHLWVRNPDKQCEPPDLRPAPAPLQFLDEVTLTSQPQQEQPTSQTPEKQAVTSLHSRSFDPESALDKTLSVGEQLETLDDLVDFHDIGDEDYQARTAGPNDPDAPLVYNPLEKAIAVARDAILDEPGIQDYSTENLPARSRIELSEMVVRLRDDRMKLQKLVIAQKAVIDSEKLAHERTRVVVKDAISVMRHARHGQRIAEKIARRERAERQRLEKDYVKTRRALDNALSTLKTRSEAEQPEAEKA